MPDDPPKCPKCGGTEFRHLHDTAHGIPGTHMSGSERFECVECKYAIYWREREGWQLGFKFVWPLA